MKRLGLLSLLAVLLMAASYRPAYAATATLSYIRWYSPNAIDEIMDVHLTGSSYWSNADFHCDGGGSTRLIQRSVGIYFGPGDFEYPGANDPIVDFPNLPAGNYTLWGVASGAITWPIPYTTWYASTGDTYKTL